MTAESPPAETILAIDDSPGNLALLHGMLGASYRVKVANNAARGLAIAQSDPAPDLILLDMKMPDMNGLEACAALKAHPVSRDIPVIFLTGFADPEDEERGLAAGAADYVVKPINQAVLLHRIGLHLRLVRAEREVAAWKAAQART